MWKSFHIGWNLKENRRRRCGLRMRSFFPEPEIGRWDDNSSMLWILLILFANLWCFVSLSCFCCFCCFWAFCQREWICFANMAWHMFGLDMMFLFQSFRIGCDLQVNPKRGMSLVWGNECLNQQKTCHLSLDSQLPDVSALTLAWSRLWFCRHVLNYCKDIETLHLYHFFELAATAL
jgi:hypothetical protein